MFIDRTGEFSENLLANGARYSGWNDGIKAARDRQGLWGAGDLFVVVSVDTSKVAFPNVTERLTASITIKGKSFASRTVRFSRDAGWQRIPFLLPDSTCAGPIQIEAKFGNIRRTAMLEMSCGE